METQLLRGLLTVCLLVSAFIAQVAAGQAPTVVRLADGPIIVPNMDGRMGSNIQGPSLICVPNG